MKEQSKKAPEFSDHYTALFVHIDKYKKLLWLAGWLFSLGYSDAFTKFHETFSTHEPSSYFLSLIVLLILTWFSWPYVLGASLRG